MLHSTSFPEVIFGLSKLSSLQMPVVLLPQELFPWPMKTLRSALLVTKASSIFKVKPPYYVWHEQH